MTPIQETEIDMEKLEKRTMPSLTWKINEEKAEVRGETNELDAMRQAVSKILQTERYRYAVYDWNYGVELEDLYGKNVSYVIPELKRRIEDALLADDRVTAVTDFSFTARMLQKYSDKIAVGVDAKDGYVAIHGWKEVSAEPGVAFCKRLAEAGCTAIIYTDIACDGAMQGTNLSLYRQLAAQVPGVAFTASGGISSEAELLELQQMGTAAAILGKSLYTGALDLARCVQLVQD